MVSSLLDVRASTTLLPKDKVCSTSLVSKILSFGLVIPCSLLVALASLSIPESPEHLESICQKHNTISACRVW